MKIAGWLAIAVSVLLFGLAISLYHGDWLQRKDISRIIDTSLKIKDPIASARFMHWMEPTMASDQATLDSDGRTEMIEGTVGAAFLIAGIAMVGSSKRRQAGSAA